MRWVRLFSDGEKQLPELRITCQQPLQEGSASSVRPCDEQWFSDWNLQTNRNMYVELRPLDKRSGGGEPHLYISRESILFCAVIFNT